MSNNNLTERLVEYFITVGLDAENISPIVDESLSFVFVSLESLGAHNRDNSTHSRIENSVTKI